VDDCDSLFGDALAQPVTWGGETSLNLPDDQPIFLQVKMKCAELFGVSWA
jgi:hypothetical protein